MIDVLGMTFRKHWRMYICNLARRTVDEAARFGLPHFRRPETWLDRCCLLHKRDFFIIAIAKV